MKPSLRVHKLAEIGAIIGAGVGLGMMFGVDAHSGAQALLLFGLAYTVVRLSRWLQSDRQ
jgi:hypothetical protein